jgi:ABC-type transporter Mla MlaB component
MKRNSVVPVNDFLVETEAGDTGTVFFRYRGEMTACNTSCLRDEFSNIIGNYSTMKIDLSEVTKIDPAAIQLMIIAKREALIKMKVLKFVNPSNEVVGIFRSYGLSHYIGEKS